MRVLLVHGLGRTPLSMRHLARTLRRHGHAPALFGYLPLREPFARIVARLATRLRDWEAAGEPYAVVGHSLGGLLLRVAAAELPPRWLQHIVMLGTPNRAPRLARVAVRAAPFRWFTGDCGRLLADPAFFERLPAPSVPYTIVAGVRGPRGRVSPFADELNDGVVALEEARLREDDPVHTVPVLHTWMMNDRRVQAHVLAALAAGAPAGTA